MSKARSSRRRRQETLWIHKWSRPIIGAIAAVGAAGTGYLTAIKLMQTSAACGTGCDKVLNSDWASLFDIPLTLFGFLAYLSMVVLALVPLAINAEDKPEQRAKLEGLTWPLLFVGATGMMIFSSFLMYVLATDIKEVCPYCIASALMSTTMFLLAVLGRRWDDRGKLLFNGVIIAMVALVGTLGVYAADGTLTPGGDVTQAGTVPAVTTTSGESEVTLAEYLQDVDAKMYGAYWCPHCHDQKQLFGKEAAKKIPYIECAEDGRNSQTALCRSIPELTGFPTWEVNGEFLAGSQSLETLALASEYTGPSDFGNSAGSLGGSSDGG